MADIEYLKGASEEVANDSDSDDDAQLLQIVAN